MKHTNHKNGIIDEKKWKGEHGGSPLNVIRQYSSFPSKGWGGSLTLHTAKAVGFSLHLAWQPTSIHEGIVHA
jgi:hypothetical protein